MRRVHRPATTSGRVPRGVAALLAGFAVLLGAAPAAHAAPPDRATWQEAGSEDVLQCGDLNLVHFWDVHGSGLLVAQGRDGLVHSRQTLQYSEGFTNPVSGRTFRWEVAVASNDLRVTDAGDGTLTIEAQSASVTRYYSGDTLLFLDSGLGRWSYRVDDAGTPTDPSDDQFLEFLGLEKDLTGRAGTTGRDFCDDLRTYTS
jgi:hypothetical protein